MTIKVNKAEWEALGPEHQAAIASIIGDNFKGQTLESSDDGVATADVGGICTTLCDAAQAVAVQLCGRLPVGGSLCVSLAQAAGDLCRSKC